MTYQHKGERLWRRTEAIQAQNVETRERQRSRLHAILRSREAETLRQHAIAVNPDSIDLDQRIRQATRSLARLWNPGPKLLKGPSPDPFYINVDVFNVNSGLPEAYHYDRRHHSADWVWDSSVTDYIPRNHGIIDQYE